MITIYTIFNDEIVNRRFYKNNTEQTRNHYIQTLRRHFTKQYKILDIITSYRESFVLRNRIPFDDNFTFVIEKQFVEGHLFSDKFFSYSFDINSTVNLTMVFPSDDYSYRKTFINEVVFYLKNYGYYEIYNQYINDIQDFINEDSEVMFVEEHSFSMRNEDD